jgi:membrane-associated protein
MSYSKFFLYNVVGAVLWVGLFIGGGYAFGNLPFVQSNMKVVIFGIILVSIAPILWELFKANFGKKPLEVEVKPTATSVE